MIAYNKTWLANQRLQDEVHKEVLRGNITEEEFKAIAAKYPAGFYSPNVFVRFGLFVLTIIIVLFADGLLSLMAASGQIIETAGWFFFLGGLSYTALELMISSKSHYRSGVDDALTFTSGGLFIIGFGILIYKIDPNNNYIAISGLTFLTCLYLTLRFTDMLAALVGCAALFAFIFFGWIKIIPSGLSTAPFVMMVVSLLTYWLAYKNSSKKEFINYTSCLVVIQVLSLFAFYASGNYYIIQTLSAEMMGKTGPVQFRFIFWTWTIAMPFVYILLGIKKKDAIRLRLGLALIAAAVLTFRNYYHILPVDIMLTIGGVVVLGVVYGLMKYLKTPKYGFTTEEPEEINQLDQLKVESLIVAETFSHAPAAPTDPGTKFGGGDFGGGGSSGAF